MSSCLSPSSMDVNKLVSTVPATLLRMFASLSSLFCLFNLRCRLFWTGETCEESWLDDKTYSALFWLYTAYTILLQSICFFLSSSQLYSSIKEKWRNIYSLPGCILSLCFFASLRTV